VLGSAPQVSLSHTVSSEIRGQGFGRTATEQCGVIRVTNGRPEAVLTVVRVRFLGHYLAPRASRSASRAKASSKAPVARAEFMKTSAVAPLLQASPRQRGEPNGRATWFPSR
jgi:hypothetical protein